MALDLLMVIQIAVPLLIALFVSFVVRKYFSNLIRRYLVKEHKGKETVFRLLERLIIAFVFIIACFISLSSIYPGVGTFLSSALLTAGFLAIVVGLAAQRTLGNVFAGLNIALARPIRIGAAVIIRNEYGNVEGITFRHTVVKTWDNRRLIIPNSVLDEEMIVNYAIKDQKKLFGIILHVPYNSDIAKVGSIMTAEARRNPYVL